jgi:lactate dehydrogenase-like 2-hydroxyacid dehydrogenase
MPDARDVPDVLDVLIVGAKKPVLVRGLESHVTLHEWPESGARETFLASMRDRIRVITVTSGGRIDAAFMQQFPRLELVASFGVGYDNVDARWAGAHGIVVTNTPDVLTEEVADTALGLLLCTVRELPQAERFLRAGKWPHGSFPLTRTTLRNRTVGMVGMGRIGQAIARRLDAFGVPVVYHSRQPKPGVERRYYSSLLEMARDVDTLVVIVPGGAGTEKLIDAGVLQALGPAGILINMARGSVVDEAALIDALQRRVIHSAGLDVFANEPHVPQALLDMEHVVLLPHLGSATEVTRAAMDEVVVANVLAWSARKPPVTPVAETPWPALAR